MQPGLHSSTTVPLDEQASNMTGDLELGLLLAA